MNYLVGSIIFLRRVWRNNPVAPTAIWFVCSVILLSLITVLRTLEGAAAGLEDNPLKDRIVNIRQRDPKSLGTGVGEAFYVWSPEVKTLTNIVATLDHGLIRLNVRFPDGHAMVIRGGITQSGLFPLFHILPKSGRVFTPADDSSGADRIALIGPKVWRTEFNSDPQIIGQQLLINGRHYTIAGVLDKDVPSFESIGIWLNRISEIEDILNNNEHWHGRFTVFAVMKPGIEVRQVQSELNVFYSALAQDEPHRFANVVPEVVPIQRLILANVGEAMQILSYLGVVVMLLGTANAVLLLIVRKLRLRTANQVRLTLGLPMVWFRTECLLEAGLFVTTALVFAAACNGVASSLVLPYFTKKIQMSSLRAGDWGWVILSCLALTVLLAAPQMFSFKGKITKASKAVLYSLVLLEACGVATVLYLSGVTLTTFLQAQTASTRGYQTENLVATRYRTFGDKYATRDGQQAFEANLLRSVGEIGGVSDVAFTTYLPLMDDAFADYLYPSRNKAMDPVHLVEVMIVSSNYLDLFGVKFLAGETFKTGNSNSLVIDSDAAKLIPCIGAECIGKAAYLMGRPFTITGVTKPVRFRHVQWQSPQVYMRSDQTILAFSTLAVITKTSMPLGVLLPKIREATAKVDAGIEPLRIDTIGDLVKESVEPERRVLNACLLVGLFGLLASFTGILVVTSQIIESQRRECGIRLALGDTAAGVVRSLCGPVVFWAVLGSGCGIFAGTVVQEKMSTLIYLNKGLDIQIALAAGLIVVISICFGLISPVQAIFRINPAELLRTLTDEAGTRG